MNKETISKLQSLCLVSLQMAQESEKTYELRSLILAICKKIDGIIDESENE